MYYTQYLFPLAVSVVRAGIPPGSDTELAHCLSDVRCFILLYPDIGFMMIAECCLSVQGLGYIIPGQEACFNCVGKYSYLSHLDYRSTLFHFNITL